METFIFISPEFDDIRMIEIESSRDAYYCAIQEFMSRHRVHREECREVYGDWNIYRKTTEDAFSPDNLAWMNTLSEEC